MALQIRLREPSYTKAYQYIEDYVGKADRALVFNHKPTDDNNHYHIYLFDIDIQPDSIRRRLARDGYAKTCYAVSTTAGATKKIAITPQLAYQYGTTKDLIEPILQKGFEQFDLGIFKTSAQVYYNKYTPPAPELRTGDTIVVKEDHYISRPDKVWEKLKTQIDAYKGKSIKQIKSMISAQWLNEGKAMPRPSDLHRYAISLHTLSYYSGEMVPDEALEHLWE